MMSSSLVILWGPHKLLHHAYKNKNPHTGGGGNDVWIKPHSEHISEIDPQVIILEFTILAINPAFLPSYSTAPKLIKKIKGPVFLFLFIIFIK